MQLETIVIVHVTFESRRPTAMLIVVAVVAVVVLVALPPPSSSMYLVHCTASSCRGLHAVPWARVRAAADASLLESQGTEGGGSCEFQGFEVSFGAEFRGGVSARPGQFGMRTW